LTKLIYKDGQGIAAALCLGATAAQIGTAFVTCQESEVSPLYKNRLLTAKDTDTCITSVFSGRPARGLMNRLVQDYNEGCESSVSQNILQQSKHIAPYPFQMALTNPLKKESLRREMTDLSSMWCGQG